MAGRRPKGTVVLRFAPTTNAADPWVQERSRLMAKALAGARAELKALGVEIVDEWAGVIAVEVAVLGSSAGDAGRKLRRGLSGMEQAIEDAKERAKKRRDEARGRRRSPSRVAARVAAAKAE